MTLSLGVFRVDETQSTKMNLLSGLPESVATLSSSYHITRHTHF